jgi:hypothetical protein
MEEGGGRVLLEFFSKNLGLVFMAHISAIKSLCII